MARQGFRVIVPDLFNGRTATNPEEAEKLAAIGDAEWPRLLADVERTLNYLRTEGVSQVGVIGLSFAAFYAVKAAAKGAVDAVGRFYGAAVLEPDDRLRAPVLGHFADDDPFEPGAGKPFFEQLRAMGTPIEYWQYPGTYHWFFEPSNPHFHEEAAQHAGARTCDFLKHHLG